jgi:hypothetical protein
MPNFSECFDAFALGIAADARAVSASEPRRAGANNTSTTLRRCTERSRSEPPGERAG